MANGAFKLQLSRTLYDNVFRVRLMDEYNETKGFLRVIPSIPTDRSFVPEDAPVVPAILVVIVEDADINKDNLIDFEERASYALLKRFATEEIAFEHCEFYYPSPAFVFDQPDAVTNPIM